METNIGLDSQATMSAAYDEIGDVIQTRGTFEWKIKDFFSLSDKNDDCYFSGGFEFADIEWYLSVYPNGMRGESNGWLGLCLHRDRSGAPEAVNYRFGIKGSDGVEGTKEFRREYCEDDNGFGISKFMRRSDLNHRKSILMPNNELTLMCDLRMDTHSDVQKGEKKFAESMLSMLESGDDSDTVIKVRGKEFPAHRAILRARSGVFRSMFVHMMVEKHSSIVNIEDCDPGTFYDFLVFLYSGSCDHISTENVRYLYMAADKYDVSELKEACSKFMLRDITASCFFDVMALAKKYNDNKLTEWMTDFFCENCVSIASMPEWQTFLAENLSVGNELFLKAMSRYTL